MEFVGWLFRTSFFFFALVSIFGFGLLSLANEESLVPAGDSLLLEIFFSSLLKG